MLLNMALGTWRDEKVGIAVEEHFPIAIKGDEPGIHSCQTLVNFGLLVSKVSLDVERFGSLAELLDIRSF